MNLLSWLGIIWRLIVPLVFAAQSLSIADTPTSLDEKAEMQVTVSLACPGCGDSYLRGVFYPSGSSYFGYTQDNNGAWSNAPGSSCKNYFAVLQSDLSKEGTWSGVIKVKPDTENAYYNGPGEYAFKVGRYTSACGSPSAGGWSTESIIAVTGPTHTPTPQPTVVPTHTPTIAPNPTSINTPTITSTPSMSPTIAAVTTTVTQLPTESQNIDILGISIASESGEVGLPLEDNSLQSTVSGQQNQLPLVISFLCIGIGFALLSTAIAWQKTDIWKKLIKRE